MKRNLMVVLVAAPLALMAAIAASSKPAPPVTPRIGFARALDPLPFFVMQGQGLGKRNGIEFSGRDSAGQRP